ncbi:YggU family protein [Pseudomonas sp. CrR25]|nr:YggU family protein [Pseudomonas sp. CrR25]
MSFYRWDGEDLLLDCHLQPKASRDEFAGQHGTRLKIRLSAPPVDGKANAQLLLFLAAAFAVGKGQVNLESGQQSRQKRVRIKQPRQLPASLGLTVQPT